MIRRMTGIGVAFLVAAALGATTLQAQDARGQGVGLQVDAGASILTGDDFEALDTGLVFTALGSYAWVTGWEVGVAAGFASHDMESTVAAPSATATGSTDAQLNNVSAVVRKRFNVPADPAQHLHPYVEGRVGWAELDVDGGGSESGLQGGLGVGLEYWLSHAVGLTGGLNGSFLSLGDASGLRIVPRAGLKVRFGGR